MLPSPGFTHLLDSLSCSGGQGWSGEEFQELAGESQPRAEATHALLRLNCKRKGSFKYFSMQQMAWACGTSL